MKKQNTDSHGSSPLPKGKSKPGAPLFKNAPPLSTVEKRDVTGQTAESKEHLNQRMRETPKRSAATEHDKVAFEKKPGK